MLPFFTQLQAIKRVRQYLIQHQRDYIDTREHFSSKNGMSDKERDEIDQETSTSLKQCCTKIDELKLQIGNLRPSPFSLKFHLD